MRENTWYITPPKLHSNGTAKHVTSSFISMQSDSSRLGVCRPTARFCDCEVPSTFFSFKFEGFKRVPVSTDFFYIFLHPLQYPATSGTQRSWSADFNSDSQETIKSSTLLSAASTRTRVKQAVGFTLHLDFSISIHTKSEKKSFQMF